MVVSTGENVIRRSWFLLAVLTIFCASSLAAQSVRARITEQLALHPASGPADLYSFLLHATLGPAHGARDSAEAARWLDDELAHLPDGPDEPLFEPMSVDGKLVRINLRPYVKAGGTRDALLAAFVRTGREFVPSKPAFLAALDSLAAMGRAGQLPLSGDSVSAYLSAQQRAGYPLASHSAAYSAAYHPAYRVVLRRLLPADIRDAR